MKNAWCIHTYIGLSCAETTLTNSVKNHITEQTLSISKLLLLFFTLAECWQSFRHKTKPIIYFNFLQFANIAYASQVCLPYDVTDFLRAEKWPGHVFSHKADVLRAETDLGMIVRFRLVRAFWDTEKKELVNFLIVLFLESSIIPGIK